ncbi:MAG: hypothetical protein O2960_27325 [Verrucomicrobia bacterium]|nr:hypothetical protein [Verrucomicrobiota bacterium]
MDNHSIMRFVVVQKICGKSLQAIIVLSLVLSSHSQDLLKPDGFTESGWFRVIGSAPSDIQNGMVYEVFRSADLIRWDRAATAQHWPFVYADASSTESKSHFYRLGTRFKRGDDDQKNIIVIPGMHGNRFLDERFFATQSGSSLSQPFWIKFAIRLDRADQVIYQDSRQYTFHYDFARRRLAEFSGLSRQEFDAVSLHAGGSQKLVLGAVLHPRYSGASEVGIQFVGLDQYPIESIAEWFSLVRSTVNAGPDTRFFYTPVFEQSALKPSDVEFFRSQGIAVGSPDRWLPGNGVYSEGWALGAVRFVASGEIDQAFAQGRLRSEDILLTDGVPAEIPLVAGIISLSPATPNSHVALLAKSFGIPFAYLRDENDRAKAQTFAGQEIYFSATTGFFFNSSSDSRVRMVPISEDFPLNLKEEMLDLKAPGQLKYTPKRVLGQAGKDTSDLTLEDIQYFGGKASNFGILRREIPDRSPEAIALSFDPWDSFMNQTLQSGAALREWIRTRLSSFNWPVSDTSALEQALGEIRTAIREGAFAEAERQSILEALGKFDPSKKIRFRSSTNVEDSDSFVGAGLYDSFSGCLADDTDNNEAGPSGCDPMEANERGIFRAIRKVYASFYNLNAYLQRLRHGVREDEVGMAILAHHSYPDEIELANGVAVVRESFGGRWEAEIVTQRGAVSVSNPDGAATPEIVRVSWATSSISSVSLSEASSLVVQGGKVMNWESDYRTLATNLFKVYSAYRKTISAPAGLQLDFEFKKVDPAGIVIKQVRPLIEPESKEIVPYLLSEPVRLATAQGEFRQGALGRHRLKSRWLFKIAESHLAGEGPAESLLRNLEVEYLDDHAIRTQASSVSMLPNYSETKTGKRIEVRWTMPIGGEDVSMRIEMDGLPEKVSTARDIVTTIRDLSLSVVAQYQTGRPEFFDRSDVGTTKEDRITLSVDTSMLEVSPRSSLQSREFKSQSGSVSVSPQFYWPPPPSGPSAGYTAPVEKWKETVIRGIGDEPIILKGFYSQTYLPGHHNFYESFIIDPRSEENIDPRVLDSLNALNVELLVCDGEPGSTGTVRFLGLNGKLRERL